MFSLKQLMLEVSGLVGTSVLPFTGLTDRNWSPQVLNSDRELFFTADCTMGIQMEICYNPMYTKESCPQNKMVNICITLSIDNEGTRGQEVVLNCERETYSFCRKYDQDNATNRLRVTNDEKAVNVLCGLIRDEFAGAIEHVFFTAQSADPYSCAGYALSWCLRKDDADQDPHVASSAGSMKCIEQCDWHIDSPGDMFPSTPDDERLTKRFPQFKNTTPDQ